MLGDPASHIMWIKNIISSGYLKTDNFYPITHIYISEIFMVTSIDILSLSKYIPLLFGILYVLFMYLFASLVLPTNSQVILATLVSATFSHEYYLSLTPNHLSNLFLPLFIYIFIKYLYTKKVKWAFLNTILVIMYPLFHPLPSLILMIFFISYSFSSKFDYLSNKSINWSRSLFNLKSNLSLIIIVWSIFWISHFEIWNQNILSIHETVVGAGSSYLSDLIMQKNSADQYGYNIMIQIIKRIGVAIFYFIVALISLPVLLKNGENKQKYYYLLSSYIPLFIICLSIPLLYLSKMYFGPLRMITYIVIICSIIFGFLGNYILENTHRFNKNLYRYIIVFFFILTLLGTNINGILNLYPSPYITSQNLQTTKYEVEGMDWILHNRNLSLVSTGMTLSQYRLSLLVLGVDEINEIGMPTIIPTKFTVPYHFGYDKNHSLEKYYNESVYLEITKKDREIYKRLLPKMEKYRWNQNDYKKLDTDMAVSKLYSNGEFDTYFVRALKINQVI